MMFAGEDAIAVNDPVRRNIRAGFVRVVHGPSDQAAAPLAPQVSGNGTVGRYTPMRYLIYHLVHPFKKVQCIIVLAHEGKI